MELRKIYNPMRFRATLSGLFLTGLLLILPSCGFVEETNLLFLGPAYTDWWDEAWSSRRQLTFNNGAQSEDLLNFPVLVRLNNDRINYGRTQDNGSDLRFVDAAGNVLSHEIEQWNEGGESLVWVKVARINGGSTSDAIWMYYGNDFTTDGQDAQDVWEAGYLGVWHLSEISSGTHADSSASGNDAGRSGNVYEAAGAVNGAQRFDGNDDYIDAGDIDALDTPGSFSILIWFTRNAETAGATNHGVNNVLVAQSSDASNDNLEIGTSGTSVEIYLDTGSGAADTLVTHDAGIVNAGLYCLFLTYDQVDANELKLYMGGSLATQWNQFTGTLDDSAASPLTFGIARGGGSNWGDFNGVIDEARVSDTARSADWVAAQYESMSDGFVSYGEEQNL
jgi:hypothetical protein